MWQPPSSSAVPSSYGRYVLEADAVVCLDPARPEDVPRRNVLGDLAPEVLGSLMEADAAVAPLQQLLPKLSDEAFLAAPENEGFLLLMGALNSEMKYAGAPMRLRGRTVGVLCCMFSGSEPVGAGLRAALETQAERVANALEAMDLPPG